MERSIWIVTICPFVPLLINDTLNKLAGVHSTVAPQGHLRRPELETKYLGSVRVTDAALCQVPGARCQVLCAKCQVAVPKCLVTGGTHHRDETERKHFGNFVAGV